TARALGRRTGLAAHAVSATHLDRGASSQDAGAGTGSRRARGAFAPASRAEGGLRRRSHACAQPPRAAGRDDGDPPAQAGGAVRPRTVPERRAPPAANPRLARTACARGTRGNPAHRTALHLLAART